MIEMYAFIAAFAAQILVFSVLGPIRVVGALREQITQFIAERSPPVNPEAVARVDRRLRLLRLLGLATAVIGLALLVAFIRYMLRPDWRDGSLEAVIPVYFMVQVLPTILAIGTAGTLHGMLKGSLPQEKRRALLQPRGLFDFVSRSTVAAAILAYFLFIALLLYIERHPFPGFAGAPVNIVAITAVYAAISLAIYFTLRTMGSSPLQAREERMRSVGLTVRILVYTALLQPVLLSVNMTLSMLAEQRWEPTFESLGVIVGGLLIRLALSEQMRIPRLSPASSALAR